MRCWRRRCGWQSGKARRAIPEDLRDVDDLLLKAIGDVRSGALEPMRAHAMANLALPYSSVFEDGDVERRIAEIESILKERDEAA
jgi:hypothetical protein